MLCGCGMLINLAALCVGEVTVVCLCVFKNLHFFLKHGNYYSYQILYATSNSCNLSFHFLTKKFIDGKPLKIKLARKIQC